MSDLTSLDEVTGQPLSEAQIRGILAQLDLDILNLARDGKLAALKYTTVGEGSPASDRAANLNALVAARKYYESLLQSLPAWEMSQGVDDSPATRG